MYAGQGDSRPHRLVVRTRRSAPRQIAQPQRQYLGAVAVGRSTDRGRPHRRCARRECAGLARESPPGGVTAARRVFACRNYLRPRRVLAAFLAGAFLAGALVAAFLAGALVAALRTGALVAAFLAGALVAAFLAGALVAAFLAGALVAAFLAGALVAAFLAGALVA